MTVTDLAFVGPDADITEWVVDHRADPLTTIARIVTVTGNTVFLTAVVVVAVIAFLATRRTAEAVLVGAGSAVGYLVMVGLKHLWGRARPPVEDRLLDIDTPSFPSGHAMMSMVVFGLVAVAVRRQFPDTRWARFAYPVAVVWSVLIGLTRIWLGVHWTTDVIAGWLMGAAWVFACAATLRWRSRVAVP